MRGPLAALLGERFGRRRHPRADPPPALPAGMGRGAGEMQERLEAARSRLKRDIAPPPSDDEVHGEDHR